MDSYIVRKKTIAALNGQKKTHFLNSKAKRRDKSLGDLTGLTGLGFHIVEIKPGFESSEYHRHLYEDECVYILQGEATVRIGDHKRKVGIGDFIGFRAGGMAHQLINDGHVVLKYIVVGQRLARDIVEYPEKAKSLHREYGQSVNLVNTKRTCCRIKKAVEQSI
jgi:uncharacterized cupin superfamily protein